METVYVYSKQRTRNQPDSDLIQLKWFSNQSKIAISAVIMVAILPQKFGSVSLLAVTGNCSIFNLRSGKLSTYTSSGYQITLLGGGGVARVRGYLST